MNITIVGGGFGGVKAALELAKHKRNHVTLISSTPYFQYYPALYSTATGHSHRESWMPLGKIFSRHKNVRLVEDTITTINPEEHILGAASGRTYKYDELIMALGSVTTYFGIEGLDTYAFGIKSEAEIRKLQRHIITDMSDGVEDEKQYVIIGAGPTGVELAGALGEYLRVLRKHFGITKKTMKISLIEAAPRVLPRLSERSSRLATKQLKKLGVHVEVDKRVEKQTAEELIVNGKPLKTQTVIWTSGVMNAPFYQDNAEHFDLNDRGKVKVDEFMRAGAHIYVIGDNANTPYAGLAQTALHDAQFVAKHLMGKKKLYKVVMPPSVIPIGHNWALFEWHKLVFGGWIGSLLRKAADLIGYHDVLPLGWALGTWRATRKKEMAIPDDVMAQ